MPVSCLLVAVYLPVVIPELLFPYCPIYTCSWELHRSLHPSQMKWCILQNLRCPSESESSIVISRLSARYNSRSLNRNRENKTRKPHIYCDASCHKDRGGHGRGLTGWRLWSSGSEWPAPPGRGAASCWRRYPQTPTFYFSPASWRPRLYPSQCATVYALPADSKGASLDVGNRLMQRCRQVFCLFTRLQHAFHLYSTSASCFLLLLLFKRLFQQQRCLHATCCS